MSEKIVKVTNLSKQYAKQILAVDNISFEVNKGEFFAFLGPNGAGKSTTINILCTILGGYIGEAEICGYKLGKENDKIQNSIGIVFQDSVLDDRLTVRENFQARASLYNIFGEEFNTRLGKICKYFDLDSLLNRRFGTLSGGQKRRTDIARALLNTPKLLFLDEPTTGLDPQTRNNVWKALKEIRQKTGMTLFLTTHYMEETDLADHVAIIDDGKIVASGTPTQLKDGYSFDTIKLYYFDDEGKKTAIKEELNKNNINYETVNGNFIIKTKDSLSFLPLLNVLVKDLKNIEIIKGDMDSVFLNVTGKNIREG